MAFLNNKQVLENLLPTIDITRVRLGTFKRGVDVTLKLKESGLSTSISVFKTPEFKQFIKFAIIEVINEQVYFDNFGIEGSDLTAPTQRPRPGSTLLNEARAPSSVKIISLEDFITDEQLQDADRKDGQDVFLYNATREFEGELPFEQNKQVNLGYIAYPFLDLASFQVAYNDIEDTKLDNAIRTSLNYTGKIVKLQALDEGRVFSEKVKDSRYPKYTFTQPPIQRGQAIFSEMFISKDGLGNNRFIFSVDFLNLFKNEGLFEELSLSEKLLNRIVASANVVNLNVVREQVNMANSFNCIKTVQYGRARKVNTSDPDVYVIQAGESRSLRRTDGPTIKHLQPSENEAYTNSIQEVNLKSDVREGIRTFTGFDGSIFAKNSGFFRYRVELKATDPTLAVLQRLKESLAVVAKGMKLYHNDAQGFGSSKAVREKLPPEVAKYSLATPKSESDKPFNARTGQFSEEFIRKYVVNPDSPNPVLIRGLVEAIDQYIEILDLLSGFGDGVDKPAERQRILSLISPVSGTPQTIGIASEEVSALMKVLEGKINFFLAGRLKKSTEEDDASKSVVKMSEGGSGAKVTVLTAEKTFDSIYDARTANFIGFDYLGVADSNPLPTENREIVDGGLKVVPKSFFDVRMTREIIKYFNGSDVDISTEDFSPNDNLIVNKYSYVSPMLAKVKRKPVYLNDSVESSDDKFLNIVMASLKRENIEIPEEFLQGGESKEKQEAAKAISDGLFEQFGITIPEAAQDQEEDLKEDSKAVSSFRGKTDNEGKSIDDPTKSEVVRRNQLKFINVMLEIFRNSAGSGTNCALGQDERIFPRDYNLSDPDSKINKNIDELITSINDIASTSNLASLDNTAVGQLLKQAFNRSISQIDNISKENLLRDFLSRIPNQLKPLYLYHTQKSDVINKRTEGIIKAGFFGSKSIKFKTKMLALNKVEILIRNDNVKNQTWTLLTEDIFNGTSGKYLCRMLPYENSIFEIKRDPLVDLPTYDQYFILDMDN